jgi:phage shock protein PspC (stress-responsive transcriptional regulator)
MKVLTRSQHGMITGTLRGFADYYDIELNRLQLLFILATFFGGIGLVAYIALFFSIPSYSQREALLAAKRERQHESE